MLDWGKLKPYREDKRRSFEQLSYQIAKALHGQSGRFTPIDGSGGDTGVEFYLTLQNGSEWGWQAKFFHQPSECLSVGNRKEQIKKSLITAFNQHPRLTRWFLCTPSTFTTGERDWFDNELASLAPTGARLEHWSGDDFNLWLSEPRFAGKRNYFFGELELTIEWFRTQLQNQLEGVRDQYNPVLHTKNSIDDTIHRLLGDQAFARWFAERVNTFGTGVQEHRQAVSDLSRYAGQHTGWEEARSVLTNSAEALHATLGRAYTRLRAAADLLCGQQLHEVREMEWESLLHETHNSCREYDLLAATADIAQLDHTASEEHANYVRRELRLTVGKPGSLGANLSDDLRGMVASLDSLRAHSLHVFGGAGVGKTHVASHICQERLDADLPALLVLGRKFTANTPLSTQLLTILDVPPAYSWSDFLQALAAAAEAYETRIPLFIDGLNEATSNGHFSEVWELWLSSLEREVGQTGELALITTCRETYREAIWSDGEPENSTYLYGFDWDQVETAVVKYFSYYKITASLTAAPLSHFEHPIYLKIYCESKNGDRLQEKHVYIGEQTLFDVFEEYLDQCNKEVCRKLRMHPNRVSIVRPALERMANFLWEHSSRSIPFDDLVRLIDGRPIEDGMWEDYKAKALLDEGLLVSRDWASGKEHVFFSYDLLAGYLIAKSILSHTSNDRTHLKRLVTSEDFRARLFGDDHSQKHPLYEDIARSLAALLPEQAGCYLHELIDRRKNPAAFRTSVSALFEIRPEAVNPAAVELVASLFQRPKHPKRRENLFRLAASTVAHVGHPLNQSFWSGLLKQLPMPERDTRWTEYAREHIDHFNRVLALLETESRNTRDLSELTGTRLDLLAEHVMWGLTSTMASLRDKSTRALYWYGRRRPLQLLRLTLQSLEINDPYIPERTLAALYGVAMARQHDFEDPSFATVCLPQYGRSLYEALFRPGAEHSTTHMLARDYAWRTVDIACKHHPNLLAPDEVERCYPPFSEGGIRHWSQTEDRNKGQYKDGNSPFTFMIYEDPMDMLGPGISKYKQTPEYREAKANLWWRIYDLGYSLQRFGEIDSYIITFESRYMRSPQEWGITTYARKYCRIALHELVGYRDDLGLMRREWHTPNERLHHADIDPSFPEETRQHEHVREDWLGSRSMSLSGWIKDGPAPPVKPYLVVDEIQDEPGPWVLLDGFLLQENVDANRRVFLFAHSLIVCATEVEVVVGRLKKKSFDPQDLPGIPEDHYTFAGEIPWADTYPPNGHEELRFITKSRRTKTFYKRANLRSEGHVVVAEIGEAATISISIVSSNQALAKSQDALHHKRVDEATDSAEQNRLINNTITEVTPGHERATFSNQRIKHTYATFDVLVPVRRHNWSSTSNVINPGRNVAIPARELVEYLGLYGLPQTDDLYDKSGRRASMTFQCESEGDARQTFTYIRKDLLDSFLAATGSALIWIVWGARERQNVDYVPPGEAIMGRFKQVMSYH